MQPLILLYEIIVSPQFILLQYLVSVAKSEEAVRQDVHESVHDGAYYRVCECIRESLLYGHVGYESHEVRVDSKSYYGSYNTRFINRFLEEP